MPPRTASRVGGGARRAVAALTIASFSVSALLGVLVLVGGELGDGAVQVLLTTALVGACSVVGLCFLATAGTGLWPLGAGGGVLVAVPLVSGLLLVWGEGAVYADDGAALLGRTLGVGAVLAVSWAQVCALALVGRHASPVVRAIRALTLVPVALLAVLLVALVLGGDLGESGARLLGVVAILDVLGTVVTSVLARLDDADGSTDGDGARPLRLPGDLRAGLDRRADLEGRPAEELLAEAVLGYLRSHAPHDPARD